MALQTREQFIRRDKATSNICTAQALLANVSAGYGIYHGPNGIKNIAKRCHLYTKILSYGLTEKLKCIDTITIKTDKALNILNIGYDEGINFRLINDEYLSISIDETTSLNDINNIFNIFKRATNNNDIDIDAHNLLDAADNISVIQLSQKRDRKFMEHETFNTYYSETSLMRYLYNLERKDLCLNTAMIPLCSCTMKLNSASVMIPITWNTVNNIHPFAAFEQTAGYKLLIDDMESCLSAVTGFDAFSLQPNSGAAGEYTGLSTIRQYHVTNGNLHRDICLVPTSAHGTNTASAAMCGYKIVAIKCDEQGYIDMADLKTKAEQHSDKLTHQHMMYLKIISLNYVILYI